MRFPDIPQAIILAHCLYTGCGIGEMFLHQVRRLAPLTTHLATATIIQQGRVPAGMIFRCDLPLTDPQLPMLAARTVGKVPALGDLLHDDVTRALVVDPVDHRSDVSRFPAPGECREIFLHAFLRYASAGVS